MKTYQDCLEEVNPLWIDHKDSVLHTKARRKEGNVPTERDAQQIINLKKMKTIAKAVGMDNTWIWNVLADVGRGITQREEYCGIKAYRFIRICQDPDGDGDESKNLFNPFKPEAKWK